MTYDDRFENPLEKSMREFVRRLNAKCRGEDVEGEGEGEESQKGGGSSVPSPEEGEDDDSSLVQVSLNGRTEGPPGTPGDNRRMSSLHRRNSHAISSLEAVDEDDVFPSPPTLSVRDSSVRCAFYFRNILRHILITSLSTCYLFQ